MRSDRLSKTLLSRTFHGCDVEHPPKWLHRRSSRWFTILVVSFSIFTDLFLYSIVVPVLPFALSQRAGVGSHDVQRWVSVLLTVYGVSLLVGSPAAGYVCDRMASRTPCFLSGLLLLLGSTLMLCFARSITLLLVARILQGLSAAVVWTVSLSILTDRVGAKGTGYAMGWITLGRTTSMILGPMLGGVVYAERGYYAVFSMAFACIGIDIILRLVLVETRRAQRWDSKIGPDDIQKPETGTAEDAKKQGSDNSSSETPDILSPRRTVSKEGNNPSTSNVYQPQPEPSQSRRRHLLRRLPPTVTLLLNARFLLAFWGCVFQSVIITGLDAVIPLFVSHTFRWTSSGAGLLFLAFVIPSFFTPITGYLSDRHGPKWYAVLGYLLMTPPLILLRLVEHNTLRQKVFLGVLLTWMGIAGAIYEIPIWVEITTIAELKGSQDPELFGEKGAVGQAYGLGNMGWALGAVLGPIWAGFVYQSASWGTMGWSLALLCMATSVPTAIWTGGYLFKGKHKKVREAKGRETELPSIASQNGDRAEKAHRVDLENGS